MGCDRVGLSWLLAMRFRFLGMGLVVHDRKLWLAGGFPGPGVSVQS
jgi:hypothetical protein